MKIVSKAFSLMVALSFAASLAIGQNPAEKPRNQKKETKSEEVFQRIINEDLKYIITKPELEAWKKLKNNEERENFIDLIWKRRDPDPDTEENEFRDEHYERIAYANEKFTSGIPGWRTDRGRIYITFGKPDSIESHPSGGSYERASYEGGGSTTTYPFEIWFYRHIDNVCDGCEIEFVDPTGTGEYRIARNANEKDAMLYIPGAGQTLREQLGLETRNDRITGNVNYGSEKNLPFVKLQMINDLMRPRNVREAIRIESVRSPVIDEKPLNFDMRVDFFRQSDDKVIATITIQTKNNQLSFKDVGGIQTAKMNVFGSVTEVSGKKAGTFEDVLTTSATVEELSQNNSRSSIYQKSVVLGAGTYKTEARLADVESGAAGRQTIGFTVPKYEANNLSVSTLILATKLRQTTDRDIGGMFVIGDKKVIPNMSSVYKRGEESGIYLQIYNAGIDQTTLKPAVEIEYVLTKNGKEVLTQKEDWNGLSEAGQRIVLAKFLQTDKLSAGDYELKIKIADRVTRQKIEPSAKFSIVE